LKSICEDAERRGELTTACAVKMKAAAAASDSRRARFGPQRMPHAATGKVERAEGRDIGLDPRFTYFRYRPQPKKLTREEHLRIAREAVAAFDAN
jgi:hypothetical protein